MNFGKSPEAVCIKKEEVSFTPERVLEICNEYADRILATSEAQILEALFRGAMVNDAHNSLGKLIEDKNLKQLLPNVERHLDEVGIPEEFYIGTLRAIARKLESQHKLRD